MPALRLPQSWPSDPHQRSRQKNSRLRCYLRTWKCMTKSQNKMCYDHCWLVSPGSAPPMRAPESDAPIDPAEGNRQMSPDQRNRTKMRGNQWLQLLYAPVQREALPSKPSACGRENREQIRSWHTQNGYTMAYVAPAGTVD